MIFAEFVQLMRDCFGPMPVWPPPPDPRLKERRDEERRVWRADLAARGLKEDTRTHAEYLCDKEWAGNVAAAQARTDVLVKQIHREWGRPEPPEPPKSPEQLAYEACQIEQGLLWKVEKLRRERVAAGAAAVEATPEAPAAPPVFFKSGEPQTFAEYDGQEHVTEYLEAAINGLPADEMAIGNHCFIGFAGTGKTLLAKITTETLRRRAARLGLPAPVFIEAFPADLGDIAALDKLMERVQANPGCVLFIDEVHDLVGAHSLKLYLVLEEHRYAAKDADNPVELPPFTFLAATTDFGAVHSALQRRFRRHQFKPASEAQLLEYVLRRGNKFPIAKGCAARIVNRTKYSGAPWEAIELYEMAMTMARGRGATQVLDQDVDKIFDLQGIDDLGLRWFDQRVVKVLLTSPRYRNAKGGRDLVCYGASESDVCAMAQVDAEEYRRSIKPRLMARGLLTMRPGYGQALTDDAVARYQVQS